MKPTRRDYCEFLVATQTNYTQTYLADYHPHFSHDAINRYLQDDNIAPAIVWEQVNKYIEQDPDGFLLFDDSVSDKNTSHKIELVRRQYSGNAHALIKGIGVVNCLYVNPKSGHYWIIDWRVFDPQGDHRTKLQHVKEMLDEAIAVKKLAFRVVLMDSWYATTELMVQIHRAGKIFYCPLKSNRLVDDSQVQQHYQAVSSLQWSDQATAYGKLIKVHKFPGPLKVKLFRDREVKQVLGIKKCRCRSAKAQRNHIGCVILAWIHFTALAKSLKTTIYSMKERLMSNYMRQEFIRPSVPIACI